MNVIEDASAIFIRSQGLRATQTAGDSDILAVNNGGVGVGRYNLLPQGARAVGYAEKTTRNTMDDLSQGVGAVDVALDAVASDAPTDADPRVAPLELCYGVAYGNPFE